MLLLTKNDIKILIASIISQELSRQNSDYFPLFFQYSGRGDLTKEPFGCDSLLLVSLATSVGDYFGVPHSGLEENFIRHRDFTSWIDIVYDSLKHYNKGINFSTSGTTGVPQQVFHTQEALEKEASYLQSLFRKSKRIVSFVRPHHIYGFLYTIVLPKYLKIPVDFYEPIPNGTIYQTPKDSLLIATPAIYDVEVKKNGFFNENITAVSSTQTLDKKTKSALRQKAIEEVVEIYGSSQSLGIGYRFDTQEYFTLFAYHQRGSLKQVQDALMWQNEREFALQGRLDEQVKHRGMLLDLSRYEKQLHALEGVQECDVVFAKGQLIAYIKSCNKQKTMHSLAMMQASRPDSIVWID